MIEHTDQVSRLEKELKEVKSIIEDLAIKNITLERENARLAGEIKELKEKIEVLEEALAYISEDDRAF